MTTVLRGVCLSTFTPLCHPERRGLPATTGQPPERDINVRRIRVSPAFSAPLSKLPQFGRPLQSGTSLVNFAGFMGPFMGWQQR